MEFTFPEDKVLEYGILKNFIKTKNSTELIDILTPVRNIISIDHKEFCFTYMNDDGKNKGGNSIILKLYESQSIDKNEVNYGVPDLILKISKYIKTNHPSKGVLRFNKEIVALNKCKNAKFQNIILISDSGICKIYNQTHKYLENHLYYTMEYAQYDLKSYIEAKHNILKIDEKLNLCISLAEGLKELISLGYYHRDIKPDNIFISGNVWKIGDLGLMSERNNTEEIDCEADQIGPRGWMSPEAMNKYLTEGKGFNYSFNCTIDHQSDIFQLGKVFWYIFQHNAPIGIINESDFEFPNLKIYTIIQTMLYHSKSKRYKTIDEVITLLKDIQLELLKSGSLV